MNVISIEHATHEMISCLAPSGLQIVSHKFVFHVVAHKSGYTVTNPDGEKCLVPKTRDVRYRIQNWKPGQLWA